MNFLLVELGRAKDDALKAKAKLRRVVRSRARWREKAKERQHEIWRLRWHLPTSHPDHPMNPRQKDAA